MGHVMSLALLAVVLAGCATATSAVRETATDTVRDAAVAPLASDSSPTVTSATPAPAKPPISRPASGPTSTPDATTYPWVGRTDLLFQAGDLTSDIRSGRIDTDLLEETKIKMGQPDAFAQLGLDRDGQRYYGGVTLYVFQDSTRSKEAAWRIIHMEELTRPGVPQSGIGDQAKLFLPVEPLRNTTLIFHICRSVVRIGLSDALDRALIVRYGDRLARRLEQVDCRGAESVPVLPPPPLLPTSTPTPTAAVVGVYSPDVTRLPDPEGANLIRAYTFLDREHGWLALGATILATENGGQTWQTRSTADSRVKAMRFNSSRTGWMETEKGLTLTQDGGSTWRPIDKKPDWDKPRLARPPVSEIRLGESYHFCSDSTRFAGPFFALDTETGWALCTNYGQEPFRTWRLYKTTDGGRNWDDVGPGPTTGKRGIVSVFFVDQQHGWIASNRLFATANGGRIWRAVGPFQYERDWLSDVSFLSPQVGFVVDRSWNRNENRPTLLMTEDAGETWREAYAAPEPAPLPNGPTQFFRRGAGPGSEGIGVKDGVFLSTSDSGRTWSQLSALRGACSGGFAVGVNGLSFPDRQHGWATLTCASRPMPTLYHTGDGGASWSALSPTGASDNGYVAISFVDQQTGYAVDRTGLLFRTNDGGRTLSPVDGLAAYTATLRFVNRDVGWELRGTQLFETRDGGRSWKPVPVGVPVQSFSLLPDGRAWVLTGETASAGNLKPDRSLLATSDGGKSWTEYPMGELPSNWRFSYLDYVQFTDVMHGWLRSDSYLFHTEDGGRSWTQLH